MNCAVRLSNGLLDRLQELRRREEESASSRFWLKLFVYFGLFLIIWKQFVVPDLVMPAKEIAAALKEANQDLAVLKSNSWYD